jgi:hypothetical protein
MRGSLPGKFLLLPDWGELLLLAQDHKRPTAGQLETTSRLWRKCRPTRVVFQPLRKMLCTYVAVRLRRTARLGGIAAASAGPQEGYRCHAYQDFGKFHRNFTSYFKIQITEKICKFAWRLCPGEPASWSCLALKLRNSASSCTPRRFDSTRRDEKRFNAFTAMQCAAVANVGVNKGRQNRADTG